MFFKKSFILIALIAIAFFIITEISSFFIGSEKAKVEIYENDKLTLNNLTKSQKENIKMLANILSLDPNIKQAYKEDNPESIKEHVSSIWDNVKNEKLIYEIHFFKPPATSFVNFSNFKSIGKDASDVRTDIEWITSSFKHSTHTMMCKSYAGLRATYPIIDDGKMLGGLSLGKKIDWLPDTIKQHTSRDAFLLYTKESTSTLVEKYYDAFIQDKQIVGEYIMADRTIDIPLEIIEQIDFTQEMQDIQVDGVQYSLNSYPIVDFNKNIMGYIFILDDLNHFYKRFSVQLMKNFIIILITALLIFFITKNMTTKINKKLKKGLLQLNQAQQVTKIGSYNLNMLTDIIEWSDEHYRILKVNKKTFEPSFENFLKFIHPDDKDDFLKFIDEAITSHKKRSYEYRVVLEDKTVLFVKSSCQVYKYSEDGTPLRMNGTIQDITEFKKLELENQKKSDELIEQFYTDSLTNLPNRNALLKDMKIQVNADIAILNIRAFKNINDVFGFEAGNFLLKELSHRFDEVISRQGLGLYRIGSDEVALLNNKIMSRDEFKTFIATIIDKVEDETFHYKDEEIDIKISVYAGICFDKIKRLEKVDIALNEANKKHKDYVVYTKDDDTTEKQENKISVINKIKYSLENDKILTYFQPIVGLDGKFNKYEALVRMQDGDKILSPYFFLEISQKTKYYHQITQRVINKTFEVFEKKTQSFSINITAEDILNEETVSFIKTKLLKYPNIHRVIFEIVESESIYNIIEVEQFIIDIKSMGAKIAIDDFGTGYSNFSYMTKLKPDYLKIDGSLIKDLDTDTIAHKIVKTIATFAHELDIKVIAEFVHSKEIFEICKELEVDEFQGYYFSEPLSCIDT